MKLKTSDMDDLRRQLAIAKSDLGACEVISVELSLRLRLSVNQISLCLSSDVNPRPFDYPSFKPRPRLHKRLTLHSVLLTPYPNPTP